MARELRRLATRPDRGYGIEVSSLSSTQCNRLAALGADEISLLPGASKGLAHDHLCIADSDLLLRIPKQSQLALSALDNLMYQASCFVRMCPSGHTPRCFGVLPPSADLPDLEMGALLVERIEGVVPQQAGDFKALAKALAAIHRLALPKQEQRAPLIDQKNSLQDTYLEVQTQAQYLSAAGLGKGSSSIIEKEMEKCRTDIAHLPSPPVCLISFDAHPGNFLLDSCGKAVLVDLEKARYGGAGFDLAHASLYTSTTWDKDISVVLSQGEVEEFYTAWLSAVPAQLGEAMQPFLILMRRLMWLWSVTWCAKWKVQSAAAAVEHKHRAENTEDWAADNNPDDLVAHVRERVDHYLEVEVIARMQGEMDSYNLIY